MTWLTIIGALLSFVVPSIELFVVFWMLAAASSFRFAETPVGLSIDGTYAPAAMKGAFLTPVVGLACIALAEFVGVTPWLGLFAAIAWFAALGHLFRIGIELHPAGAIVTLRCASIAYREYVWARPWAYLDGWGDFADPLAIHIADRDGTDELELGWLGAKSGDTGDVFVERFNTAVAEGAR